MTLTETQNTILLYVKSCIAEQHMPPTIREIAQHMGYRSDNAAYQHLQALQRKGVLELEGRSRGIRLLVPTGLPLVGQVAAGAPILAEENIEAHIPVEGSLFSPRADFMLKVRGMSMMDAGILDGDLLAVKKTPHAEQNQIVVVRIEDEVTVKKFRRRQNIVSLIPANPDFEPIKIDLRSEPLEIEGVMAGLIRKNSLVKV